MNPTIRRLITAVAGTRAGKALLFVLARERPDLLTDTLGYIQSNEARIRLDEWPQTRPTFEEIAPLLLTSSAANRGLSSMRLDEIAFLWSTAAAAGDGVLVEIGRERGGSTLVLASAMSPFGELWSYDPQTKLGDHDLDRELSELLVRLGIDGRVHLQVEDSHVAEPPPEEYALVLIDGDESPQGMRQDFDRFARRLRTRGVALFHDATPGAPRAKSLAPLLAELDRDPAFARQPDVGTFAVFARR